MSSTGPKTGCGRSNVATLRSSAEGRIGETIGGKYVLRMVLSEEASAWGFQAEHEAIGRVFELRVLPSYLPIEGPDSARLFREARIAGIISHPNLRSIVDSGTDEEGRPYLVYEPLAGYTLTELVDRMQYGFPVARAVRLVSDVLEGVRAMHAARVVHRHLDPNAVMVISPSSGSEMAKVVRLDEAMFIDEPPVMESSSRRLWPGFLAPEMRRGDIQADQRTDVYGLGMLLRTLLCGGTEGRGEVPEPFNAVIEKATASAVDARYRNITDFRVAMENADQLIDTRERNVSRMPDPPPPADPLASDLRELRVRRDTMQSDLAPPSFAVFDRVAALLIIEAVYKRCGPQIWENIVLRVPEVDTLLPQPDDDEEYLRKRGVPVTVIARLLAAADALGGSGDLGLIAEIGDSAARRGLRRVVEEFPDPFVATDFPRWVAPIWGHVIPKGEVTLIDRSPGGFRMAVRRQPHPTIETCAFMAGLMRGVLRANGAPKAQVHTPACEALGDAACLFTIQWGDLQPF